MPRKTHTINPPHVVMDGAHGLKVKNRELQKGRVKSSKRLKYLPLFFVLTARLKRELLASSFNQIVILEGIDVCIYIYTYRTCMASSAENKSFYEVPKYVINTRPHCPKLMKFTCYTHVQSCNTESCIQLLLYNCPKLINILS